MGATDSSVRPSDDQLVEDIKDGDALGRLIFHATSFEADVVSENALLTFRGNRNPDGSFDESLALLRITTPEDVHEAGCTAALSMNDNARARRIAKGRDPDPVPGEDKRYYCGFTKAEAAALKISGANYFVEVRHARENGSDFHVSIFLRPKAGRKLVANDRTEAGRLLALQFKDPEAHVCDYDRSELAHPVILHGTSVLEVSRA